MLMTQSVESNFINSITYWFQPIYHLKNNNVIGYEALLRDALSSKISPVDIFREADRNGYCNILNLISLKKALEIFKEELSPLFLNIFPSTLLEKNFLSYCDGVIRKRTH